MMESGLTPRLAACDARVTLTHGSVFAFPACRPRRYLGARRDPPFPPSAPLPPPTVICFLLTLKASWREGGREGEGGKMLKQIPGWSLTFLSVKRRPAVWSAADAVLTDDAVANEEQR